MSESKAQVNKRYGMRHSPYFQSITADGRKITNKSTVGEDYEFRHNEYQQKIDSEVFDLTYSYLTLLQKVEEQCKVGYINDTAIKTRDREKSLGQILAT